MSVSPVSRPTRPAYDDVIFDFCDVLPGMAGLLHDLDAAGVRCWGLTNFTVKYVDAASLRAGLFL